MLANPEGLWNQPLLLPITNAFALAALAASIGSDLSCEPCRRTLYQPFDEYLAHNSSELIASISTDVN